MLVEAACDWARKKEARAIYLMVTSNNETASAFYKRLGFKETGHSEPYPNDPTLIEYEMVLAL
jgi:ribosomal protein S18 acetylase RimI-like enzyme